MLETCTSRTRLVQQSRHFPAGAGSRYFAYRLVKDTIFQLELETCTSCARLVLQGCDFQLELGFAHLCFAYEFVLQSRDVPAGAGSLYFAR